MGIFDFFKRPTTRGLTAQGRFLKKLITGKTTAAERKAEAKKFATGLAITAPAIAIGAIPGAGIIAGRAIIAAAKPIGTAIVRKPVVAIVGAGVLVSGAAPTIIKTLFKAGKTTGEVITGEKALTGETIAEVGKGVGALLGVAAVGTAVGIVAKKFIDKKKEDLEEIPTLITEKPVGIEGETPITPETTSITKEKRPYKPRRAKITPSVRQYVKINIISKPVATGMRIINKRYISQGILA